MMHLCTIFGSSLCTFFFFSLRFCHIFIVCTDSESGLKRSHRAVLKNQQNMERLMTKTLYELSLIFWSMKHSLTINKDISQRFITIQRVIKFKFTHQNTVRLSVACQLHFLMSDPINLVILLSLPVYLLTATSKNC